MLAALECGAISAESRHSVARRAERLRNPPDGRGGGAADLIRAPAPLRAAGGAPVGRRYAFRRALIRCVSPSRTSR